MIYIINQGLVLFFQIITGTVFAENKVTLKGIVLKDS